MYDNAAFGTAAPGPRLLEPRSWDRGSSVRASAWGGRLWGAPARFHKDPSDTLKNVPRDASWWRFSSTSVGYELCTKNTQQSSVRHADNNRSQRPYAVCEAADCGGSSSGV